MCIITAAILWKKENLNIYGAMKEKRRYIYVHCVDMIKCAIALWNVMNKEDFIECNLQSILNASQVYINLSIEILFLKLTDNARPSVVPAPPLYVCVFSKSTLLLALSLCLSPCAHFQINSTDCRICCAADKPHNPMVNAGAIVCTSLIKVKSTSCFVFFLTYLFSLTVFFLLLPLLLLLTCARVSVWRTLLLSSELFYCKDR